MLLNRDFFGTEIRNTDEPVVQQLLSLAKHVGSQGFTFELADGDERKMLAPLLFGEFDSKGKLVKLGKIRGLFTQPRRVQEKLIERLRAL